MLLSHAPLRPSLGFLFPASVSTRFFCTATEAAQKPASGAIGAIPADIQRLLREKQHQRAEEVARRAAEGRKPQAVQQQKLKPKEKPAKPEPVEFKRDPALTPYLPAMKQAIQAKNYDKVIELASSVPPEKANELYVLGHLLHAHACKGDAAQFAEVVEKLKAHGLAPGTSRYLVMEIKLAIGMKDASKARDILEKARKRSRDQISLLPPGDPGRARLKLDELVYRIIVVGLFELGQDDMAYQVLQDMLADGIPWSSNFLQGVVAPICEVGKVQQAAAVLEILVNTMRNPSAADLQRRVSKQALNYLLAAFAKARDELLCERLIRMMKRMEFDMKTLKAYEDVYIDFENDLIEESTGTRPMHPREERELLKKHAEELLAKRKEELQRKKVWKEERRKKVQERLKAQRELTMRLRTANTGSGK